MILIADGVVSSDSDLNEATHGATGLQIRAMKDPFPRRHRCQVFLITQRSPDDDVGAAGVEGLLVQNNTTFNTKHKSKSKEKELQRINYLLDLSRSRKLNKKVRDLDVSGSWHSVNNI